MTVRYNYGIDLN